MPPSFSTSAAWAASWLLVPALLAGAEGEPKEVRVNLGGARKAKAVLTTTATYYAVTVTMLPVTTFDPATNARLNRQKARALALRALARQLSDKPDVQFVVSGARVTTAGPAGDFFRLTLQVPRDGVTLAAAGTKAPASVKSAEQPAERVTAKDALLTRAQDHADTLERLAVEWDEALGDGKRQPPGGKGREAFYSLVAELEERAQSHLDALAAEVPKDSLLLRVEKEALARSVERQRERMLSALKSALREFDAAAREGEKP